MKERERFSSRLGFILISAGCAIGLGNVWRFPYITGQYGGAAFVLVYLLFLVILGLPIMVVEFSMGRASRKSIACCFKELEPKGTKWHWYGYAAVIGNYLLMMFYTTVGGWMLYYTVKMAAGSFEGMNVEQVGEAFAHLQAQPGLIIFWMLLVCLIGIGICSLGLVKGVERITKWMMAALFVIMAVLCIHSFTLEGAAEGLKFYLVPDFSRMVEAGLGEALYAALGQAFFTLSIGMGSMVIFGSYIGKERSLTGEGIRIEVLDTVVALMAGLIIFPACFSFGVDPGQGPGLVFVTLPNIFAQMSGGRLWGTLFFIFMSFAALSTIIAIFENLIGFSMELWGWNRKKSVLTHLILIPILSLPCVFGFNIWSGIQPLGAGSSIMDLEDFIISNNLLPLGSCLYLLFITRKCGWGWKNFIAEADAGKGIKFPQKTRFYMAFVLPIIILLIFVVGYWQKFFA